MTIDRWLTIALGLVGIVVSWLASRHYYRRSDKKRVPTFVVASQKELASPGLSLVPGIAIFQEGKRIGLVGITSAQIYFWNSGSLPVLKSDLIEPYRISVPTQILSCSIDKASREAIDLTIVSPESDPWKDVVLDFALLEPGDGVALGIVYEGPRAAIEFKGACLGAAKPLVLPPDRNYLLSRHERLLSTYVRGPLRFLSIAAMASLFPVVLVWVAPLFGDSGRRIVALAVLGLGLLVVLGGLSIGFWEHIKRISAPYVPPELRD